ncbi:MAG: HAMP domain-containing sensor histidine kinase [Cyclobacteriaceae bacterium]|nr:HAMP domain-containing sensor histidine kinase [Cyclobacteriaceae bacterium]
MPHIRKSILQLRAANSRLVATVFTAMLIIIAYLVVHAYYNSLAKSKAEVLERLRAIAFTSVWLINGDDHDSLANNLITKGAIVSHTENRIYNTLHNTLKTVSQANHLESPLYTITYYEKDTTFHFIVTSSDQPYYRHSYKNYPKDLFENYQTGGILDSYQDEYGHWLSAFAPLKNSKGKVIALLKADENFESFIIKAKKELLYNTFISLLIVLPFGLALLGYLSNTLRKQARDQATLVNQKEEIEAQNEEIKTQNDIIEKQNGELDQRVKERTLDLETSNKELANFLYHSSHDVQAPIATLKGLESLAIQETKEPLTKEYLTLIKDTTAKLERMVKTIQLVHHIKTTQLSIESVNLYEKISCVFNSLPQNDVHLEIDLPPSININIDAELLENCLKELFRNSIQYNQDNLNLKIKLSGQYSNKRFNLLIEDNGIGISAEAKKDLFTMFKRGNEKSTGIGLGLYIAQTCIERMSGRISVKEFNQIGVHFQISLPA